MKKVVTKNTKSPDSKEYIKVLLEIKQHIRKAQVKAAFSVNRELLKLYWTIGQIINKQQEINGWGSKSVEKLAEDIQKSFPGLEGFSRSNIFNMRAFFSAYELVQQPAGLLDNLPIFNIPWFHNVIIIQKVKNTDQRLWYAHKAIENGWSRSMLETWIESDLFNRQGKALTNFKNTLPSPDSDMAQQILKDPYSFDFLTLHEQHVERDIEQGLIDNVQKLLLEMGKGFALVGRQYHLEVDEQDYYIDLLFYHTKLKCYFVVELKSRKFDVKDLGQLSFYLSAVDDLVRDKNDKPTLGLLLCKTKKKITAEYALRNINRPIGVAEYTTKIINQLPKEMKSKLPTIAEIESELEKQTLINTIETTKQTKNKSK